MTDQLEGQMSIFDLDMSFGKMFLEPSPQEKVQTSPKSLKNSVKSSVPICLILRYPKEDGANQGASTMKWESGALLGEYTMPSTGEYPREENASHLSQILQDSPLPKYSLSEKACSGILRRAKEKDRELPDILRTALESVANGVCD